MVRVPIVDDESSVRSTVRRKLEDYGHRVMSASDGREALRIADRQQPVVAIVDILMPEMKEVETIVSRLIKRGT
jgi:CheY-like chemotaxis protein